ncbi:TetR/AcrR family transcriptional regulator [Paeniglutamicibacter sp. MACA_103]|uniref:TetR/AcrR family transcriptional regulator n=1 Tax=Paeniglutamicibacter sp. MACA_103 TaxID=3377337 RepID=UPI00389538A7
MDDRNVGAREARRSRQWTQIHGAAVTLVMEKGLSATTIDAVAEAAGVSRRSFFNYFPTKEDAVLGTRDPWLPEEDWAEFVSSALPVLPRTATLLAAVLNTSTNAGEGFRRRRDMVRTFPELRRRTHIHVQAAEQLVATALIERLKPHQAALLAHELPPDPGAQHALVLLAGTITRYAFTEDPEEFARDWQSAVARASAMFGALLDPPLG